MTEAIKQKQREIDDLKQQVTSLQEVVAMCRSLIAVREEKIERHREELVALVDADAE